MAELIREDDTLNQGRKKLNNAIKAFNETVVEGDSSVEAAQARVDEKGQSHTTLKDRIDDGFTKVNSQLAQKPTYNEMNNALAPKADRAFVENKINAMASGTPKIIVQSFSNLPPVGGEEKLALVLDDGHKYYDNGTVWVDAGPYQSTELGEESVEYKNIRDNSIGGKRIANYIGELDSDSFELGLLHANLGHPVDSTTRVRTIDFYKGFKGLYLKSLSDTIQINVYLYSIVDKSYIDNTGFVNEYTLDGDYYIKLTMRCVDSREVVNISNLVAHLSHSGDGITKDKLANEAVSLEKTDFLTQEINARKIIGLGIITGGLERLNYAGDSYSVTYKIPLRPYQEVSVSVVEGSRFIIGILNSKNPNNYDDDKPAVIGLDRIVLNSNSLKEYTYTNDADGVEMYVYINPNNDATQAEAAQLKVFSKQLIAPREKVLIANNISEKISISQTEFLEEVNPEFERLENYGLNITDIVYSDGNALTYKAKIKPYQTVKLKAVNNNRFRIGLLYRDDPYPYDSSETDYSLRLDKIINLDGISEYTFTNDKHGRELYLYVHGRTATPPKSTYATIEGTEIRFVGDRKLVMENTDKAEVVGDTGIQKDAEIYPVLVAVKNSNANDYTKTFVDTPRPIGWLYYHPVTFQLLYASGSPDNMKFLCDWDFSVTWDGRSTPAQYRPTITKNGDIVFVWRGDLIGRIEIDPNARQNPIVYPAGDYDNPVEVDLGEGIKPTSWQRAGAEYLYNEEALIFSEYTRPSHGQCHIWKVTEPVTDPENWQIKHTFQLSGDWNDGMKHFHATQYDPFSGAILASTGDDIDGAKILMSRDKGETWTIEFENDPSIARLSNFLFTKDKIYWASDDYDHYLISVDRDSEGYPDISTATKIYDLRPHPPTYITCLIEDPYGILILNRHDWKDITTDLPILFWDIEAETLHEIAVVHPTPDRINGNSVSSYGFRAEAVNFYQQRGQSGHVVGFADPPNQMDILNNGYGSNAVRINNMRLKVTKEGSDYGLKFEAFQDRS